MEGREWEKRGKGMNRKREIGNRGKEGGRHHVERGCPTGILIYQYFVVLYLLVMRPRPAHLG